MTARTVSCIVCKVDVATSGEGDSWLVNCYWNCKCSDAYIRYAVEVQCARCGLSRAHQTDSRISEVIAAGLPILCQSCMLIGSSDEGVVVFVRVSSMNELLDYVGTNLEWDSDPDLKAPVEQALNYVDLALERSVLSGSNLSR